MGDEIQSTHFTRADRSHYRHKVRRCLDVFEQMLAAEVFRSNKILMGIEVELNLITEDHRPAMNNSQVLDALADPDYQTELGRFNIELNGPVSAIDGARLTELEEHLRTSLNRAESVANQHGCHILMVGIMPTLVQQDLEGEWMSPNPRFAALQDAVLAARREDIELDIVGAEELFVITDSIAPESACTSVQLHYEVNPEYFADYWNAAQALAGPQLALGANSPFLFGHNLWAETRRPLFLQATDTRSPELRNQGVRPMVWFGDHWITSIFDLFEENVRYFPALLPEITEEDPAAVFAAGQMPKLQELRLHNGTIYRWNRPVYDVIDGQAHVRLENRVLPAGPTVADTIANAAFFYGAVTELATDERPVWSKMSFSAANENFDNAARDGVDATFYWPGYGHVPWDELVIRELLPRAYAGLEQLGVDQGTADYYLQIIEQRARTRRNGAWWQVEAVRQLQARGLDRPAALKEMQSRYARHMHTNQPVHTWPLPAHDE